MKLPPTRSFEASILSIPLAESGDRRLLAARLRDSTVILTARERGYLADLCEKRLGRKRGRPQVSDVSKLWVASDAIRFEERIGAGRARFQTIGDDAVKHAAQVHGRSERRVWDYIAFARQYQGGAWWEDACEQAHVWKITGVAAGTGTAAAVGASIAAAAGTATGKGRASAEGSAIKSN